jgi:hypothetical protein
VEDEDVNNWPERKSAHCAVCGTPLQALVREAYPVCRQVACRMVVAKRPAMGDVLFTAYLERHVRQLAEQATRNQGMRKLAAREAIENDAGWAALEASVPAGAAVGIIARVVLPSGPSRQIKLSRLRRKRYSTRLRATIATAFAAGAPLPPQDDGEAPVIASRLPGHLCAACGGGCCTSGSDHAYLTVATIRRYIARHPDAQAQQVFAAYHGRLAARTQAGSCIHHGAEGCTLSRDMRSEICNNFACGELRALEIAQRSDTPVQTVFVVRRKLDQWVERKPGLDNPIVALAVLAETGIRTMPIIAEK